MNAFIFLFLERRQSISTPPTELISNPLEITENETESQPITVEIKEEQKKLIQKETVETGSVKFRIFSIYIRACKISTTTLIIIFFCLTTFATLCGNIWLCKWTDKSTRNDTSSLSNSRIRDMNIYSALGITQGKNIYLDNLL
jgi:hypothetical protein